MANRTASEVYVVSHTNKMKDFEAVHDIPGVPTSFVRSLMGYTNRTLRPIEMVDSS